VLGIRNQSNYFLESLPYFVISDSSSIKNLHRILKEYNHGRQLTNK
jgi:hypothetical protein